VVVDIPNEEVTEKLKGLGRTRLANEKWQEVFGDWGKISTKESNQSSYGRRVRTNHSREKKSKEERETIFFSTKSDCKKDSTL
jgi:hypothetical protein